MERGIRRGFVVASLALVAMGLISFQTRAIAQDVGWEVISPKNGETIKGPVGAVDVCVAKPAGREGILHIKWTSDGLAMQWDLEIAASPFEFVTVTNGVPMADGTYTLTVSDEFGPQEILAASSFSIETDDDSILHGPTIDTPIPNTVFPPMPPTIRFSGNGEGRVYFVLVKHRQLLMTQVIEIPKGSTRWNLDMPWIYDRGDYSALLFTIDPIRFSTLPCDSTWFTIADDIRTLDTPIWAVDPKMYTR